MPTCKQTSHAQEQFTLEIIVSSLRAISMEMFHLIRKTSVSPIIYEVLDMGVALTDAKGRLVTSGAGLPSFIGILNKAVQFVLKKHQDNIHEGDVFITNSPYHGGITHLNDVILMKPLFCDEALIAWAVNMGHWPDVGGKVSGSLSGDASEIFQEGLIIPSVKLFDKGEKIDGVFEMLFHNSRLPHAIQGDLWAGISALRLGQKRIDDMAQKYGINLLQEAMTQIIKQGYTEALKGLNQLPQGTFQDSIQLDSQERLSASITITQSDFIIDLTDAPEQTTQPLNVSYEGTWAAAQILFKALVAPDTPANEGNYFPIQIKTRQGSLFHASSPAPQGFNFEIRMAYFDLLWKITSQFAPHVVGAGNFSSICGTFIGGIDAYTKRPFTIVEPQVGGWGASESSDGTSALFSPSHGDTFNCPAEIAEARYGVQVERVSLNPCQSGQGQFRGGQGICVEYRCLAENMWITTAFSKSVIPVWGLNEGHNGGYNLVKIQRLNKTWDTYAINSMIPLKQGELIQILSANGGGYGNPQKRKQQAILNDLKNDYITPQTAKEIYQLDSSLCILMQVPND